jgi:S-adenosylmethionine:tRNA ribosyltransferase-isomerase
MKTEKLRFYLPAELIAQQPLPVRSDSRLLVLDRANGSLTDSRFERLGDFLSSGDCLVLNDTKVLPARFFARRNSGAKIEGLFLTEITPGIWDVMLKGAGKIRPGEKFYISKFSRRRNGDAPADFCTAEIIDKKGDATYRLKIDAPAEFQTILNRIGFPPLPPYIKRDDDLAIAAVDKRRYQTVYARRPGAIAAPTAGLHFTNQLIGQLKQAGIRFAYVTLHVGTGTFKPIKTENVDDHKIHQEWVGIDAENAAIINAARENGGRIIAVGTTSTRALETAAPAASLLRSKTAGAAQIRAMSGSTGLFIKPGYEFKIVDAMITNFHLPKSTLLALVVAFAGLENILAAYQHAIEERYRFYSYGDAMLII